MIFLSPPMPGNNAVHVGMETQLLAPCMEYTDDARCCPKMFCILSKDVESVSGGLEQQVEHRFAVVDDHAVEIMG